MVESRAFSIRCGEACRIDPASRWLAMSRAATGHRAAASAIFSDSVICASRVSDVVLHPGGGILTPCLTHEARPLWKVEVDGPVIDRSGAVSSRRALKV